VKGYGCRPFVSYPPVLRAGVRKPPRKEPAGAGRTASGLWGFDGAVAWVRDALAGVIGGGLTIAVVSLAPRWPLTGDFGLIDGIGRAVGGAGATATRRRKRGSPAGGRCNEAVMGVMGSCA
jgi:hypothetical protein